jgi:polar amino acid transport system substrate-binding protein
MQKTPNIQNFEIIGPPFSKEGIACMVPANNSTFLDGANYSLVRFMQGLLRGKKSYVQIFNRWFGPQSAAPLTNDLRGLVMDNMQQVLDLSKNCQTKICKVKRHSKAAR